MKYSISLSSDISRLLTILLGYIILFISVLAVYQKEIPKPMWLIGIPLILIYNQLIQYYCFQPILYILLHGLLWIPAALIPFPCTEYRYLFFIMLFCENMRAINVWKTGTGKSYDGNPWHLFLCVSLIYLVAHSYDLNQFAILIYYLGLGILLLHFVRLFINGLTKLMTKSEQATSMPAKKIILTNSFIFAFFLIALVIIAVWVLHSRVDTVFAALGDFLVKGIRFIIRLIAYISAIINALFAKDRPEETEEAAAQLDQALEEISEPSLLAQIIEGMIIIAAIFILIYLTYRVIVALVKIFTKQYVQDSDVVVQLSKPKEITQLPKERNSILKRIQEFFKNDNTSKIRRAYRLKITSYKPVIFKKHDTPTDIAIRIHDTYDEDIEELTQVYEKARYSDEEITFEDVQKGGLL